MASDTGERLLAHLIELTRDVSQGVYDRAGEVFEFTKTGEYPERIVELAESFGMMIVKVEGREFQLEQIIEELRQKNEELEATLRRVALLEHIKTHLSKFVPESVKKIIETAPEAPDLEKHEMDVSVLFLDIAGYTRMSESVEFEDIHYLVERYFSSFLDDIYENKGDINETAGDGLMIIFQDADLAKHAENAVRTAVAIHQKVQVINRDLGGRFDPIVINIGINSGHALVGSSRFEGITGTRWTFTASGPVTNVAARIGQLAKEGKILIGEETARRVGGRFNLEPLGPQSLKNVSEPVNVFMVKVD